MNHNEYKQLIQLSTFGELNENEQLMLQKHLAGCDECRSELEQAIALMKMISEDNFSKINDETLSAARYQLKGALKVVKSNSNFLIDTFQSTINFFTTPLRFALGSAVLLAVGILVGSFIFSQTEVNNILSPKDGGGSFILLNDKTQITNVLFTDSDPSDGQVEFTFDAVQPVYVKGSITDPKIQNVLTYSMLNEQNPGVRLNSINAMGTNNVNNYNSDIMDALITVVMTDENPGVRREAIKLMQKLPYTENVKEAYLYVLTSDTNSGLRIEALNALIYADQQGYKLNKNQIYLIKQKLEVEDNFYIKSKTNTILQEYN